MAAAAPCPPVAAVPWTLRAAAAVIAVEALAEALAVAGRSNLTPGLRGALVVCIGLKWLLAWRVVHLSAGAALGLLMFEGTAIVAAFGAVATDLLVRLALGGTALVAIVLLACSLHAFPSPAMPKP
jgi:CDP-diglyceride synthetase